MSEKQWIEDDANKQAVLNHLLRIASENKGNEYAQLSVANGIARLYGQEPPHDLDAWIETGDSRPHQPRSKWARLRRWLRL